MKALLIVLLLCCITSIAGAATKPCSHCKHPARQCTPAPACSTVTQNNEHQSLGAALISGFGVRAGWRWQPEQECPTLVTPHPPITHQDPFFLGLEFRVPVYEQVSGFVTWDVDVDHSEINFRDRHQTSVGLVWQPGRH